MNASIKTYVRLLNYIKKFWVQFLLGIFGTALASGIAAAFMWFLKPLLNKGFISPNPIFIHWIPFIVIGAYFALGAACFLGDYFIALVARSVILCLQQEVFRKLLQLPAKFFSSHASGRLLAILTYNIEQVADACTTVLITVVKDIFFIAGLVVVMFMNSRVLALLFLVSLPFVIFIFKLIAYYLKQISLKIQDAVSDMSHITEEVLEGGHIVRSFCHADYENKKFQKATELMKKRQVQLAVVNSLGTSLSRVVVSIIVAISIYLATHPLYLISPGAFISTIAAMFAVFKPLKNLTSINNLLQKGIAGAESVFHILDENIEQDHGELVLPRTQGEIEYQHVYFQYPTGHKFVLKDISFHIKPGEVVALVGRSGSGKSTLVSLLSRFYDYQQGSILLDGKDIKEITLDSLRRQFAIVPQHIVLFNDTIGNNIAYGSQIEPTIDQLKEVSKAAHLCEFIEELPTGFNTEIGENGLCLSGGQRQRIAIARALLKDAPILILDEATSVLDAEAEQHIQIALRNLMQNRTTLVIAHRLSTILQADKILVLDCGHIVGFGQHEELKRDNAIYRMLYEKQYLHQVKVIS